MPRRIKRSADKEEIFKTLTDPEGDYEVFNTMKDIFLLAASIGFFEGKKETFEKSSGDIPWPIFRGDTDEPFIDSIAIAETDDLRILLQDEETYDKKFRIVEEYANYGMRVLQNKIIDTPGDPIDNLVSLIMENENIKEIENKNLSDFLNNLI